MFYSDRNKYIYEETDIINITDISLHDTIFCPLNIDTEFQESKHTKGKRQPITVQIKGINDDKKGRIYIHEDFRKYCMKNNLIPRHSPITYNFSPLNYLEDNGLEFDYGHEDNFIEGIKQTDRKIIFQLYSHFAIAEFLLIATGKMKDCLKMITHKSGNKNDKKGSKDINYYNSKGDKFKPTQKVVKNRRLKLQHEKNKEQKEDFIYTDHIIGINGKYFKVCISIVDTIGVVGYSSYANLAKTCGIKLKYKDTLSQTQKENMIDTYFNSPKDYDNYSLGDLELYEILQNYCKLIYQIRGKIGVNDRLPSLTMGATTEKLFLDTLHNHLGIINKEEKENFNNLLIGGNTKTLKTKTEDNTCLLSKVIGGRCFNNRPLDSYIEGLLCDIDISGCYSTSLLNQNYYVGTPLINSYRENDRNDISTMKEWINENKKEFLGDNYFFLIDTTKHLSFKQDIIPSWFDFRIKDIQDMDHDHEVDPKTGRVKILYHQIKNGLVNHDILQVLQNYLPKKHYDELINNSIVVASIIYPKSGQLSDIRELIEFDHRKGVNIKNKGNKQQKTTYTESKWIRVNIGELISHNLIALRKLEQHKSPDKKTPLNLLYKLLNNSLYGVFCSPFFEVSNTLVGNGITAKGRMFCYGMEKAFFSHQSITDGSVFSPNKVVFPEYKNLNLNHTMDLYRKSDRSKKIENHIQLKPLNNQEIHFDGHKAIIENKEYSKKEFKKYISEKTIKHLQNVFSDKIDIFHKEGICIEVINDEPKTTKVKGLYQLEVKDFFCCGFFHSMANYLLVSYSDLTYISLIELLEKDNDLLTKYLLQFRTQSKIAFRSYKNKKHKIVKGVKDEKIIYSNEYFCPSFDFISQLNKPVINRSKVFVKRSILDVKQYANNYDKYDEYDIEIGDNLYQVGLLKEFSVSQFTYKTIDHLLSIEKEVMKNKGQYGQSYEGFFTDKNNKLSYHLMLETIENIIYDYPVNNPNLKLNKILDKNFNRSRDKNIVHSEYQVLLDSKELILVSDYDDREKDTYDKSLNITFIDGIDIEVSEDVAIFDGEFDFSLIA